MLKIDWLNYHTSTVDHPGMWDDTFLRELFDGVHGPVPEFGTVVVIPGRYHINDVTRINEHLAQFKGVLVIITADEASEFPADQLEHENMVVWVQTLRPGRFDKHFTQFPLGYPPDTRDYVKRLAPPELPPDREFWFSGQDTHERRHDAIQALSAIADWWVHATPGFTQGFPREDFVRFLSAARVAPCPAGPETQETFRMWEALQAGAIPILDQSTPRVVDDGYWQQLFEGETPLPILRDWDSVRGHIDVLNDGWPHTSNKVQAWWSRYRRDWAKRLTATLSQLEGIVPPATSDELVTVLVPTSPVPGNPSTEIIEETIASVRARFPRSEIRIMVDGVRAEQWDRTPAYHEYTRRLLWLVNNEWWNTVATVHDVHQHQARMTRHELGSLDTPLLLFVEHDTPLVNDWPVEQLVKPLLDYSAFLIRMHHEHEIHREHRHLMLDAGPADLHGLPLTRTMQWSQRPHLARVDKYDLWLHQHFPTEERFFIEDRMHSVVQTENWGSTKIWLYTPEGNQQRSIHRDARAGDAKW